MLKKSKLLALFDSLVGEDIYYCRQLIKSPIYNPTANGLNPFLLLFEVLVNKRNQKESIENDEELFTLAFKDNEALMELVLDNNNRENFDCKKISRLKSDLVNLIKEHFILKAFKKDAFSKNIYLLKALRQQKEEITFKKTYNVLQKNIDDFPLKNADYHQYRFALHYEYYNNEIDKIRKVYDEFETANKELDYYLVSQKLKNICISITDYLSINRSNEKKLNALELGIIAFAQELIQAKDAPPIIQLYYSCYAMLLEEKKLENQKIYANFSDNIRQYHSILNKEELGESLQMLINFCTRKIKRNEERDFFSREQIEHYKFGFKQEVLPKDGIISKFIFKNIVTAASQMRDYDWVLRFVTENKGKLAAHEKETSTDNETFIQYMESIIYFKQRNYEKVIELLQEIKLADKDYGFGCDVRRMLVCSYFELKQDNLDAAIESFEAYLKRHKKRISTYLLYKNFVYFVKKLIEFQGNKDAAEKKAKIIEKFNAITVIAEREWLAEKWGVTIAS